MNNLLKAILNLMMYTLIQSFILALFVSIIWQTFLTNSFNLNIGYFEWWGIIFIINLLRFDTIEKINNFNDLKNFEDKKNKEDEIY